MAINQATTVATQSAQVWLSEDLEGLGWYRGSGLVTAIGCEFATWADMTHTLASERAWREATNVAATVKDGSSPDDARSVAYFCSSLSESEVKAATGGSTLEDKINSRLDRLLGQGSVHSGQTRSMVTILRRPSRSRVMCRQISRARTATFSRRPARSLPASRLSIDPWRT